MSAISISPDQRAAWLEGAAVIPQVLRERRFLLVGFLAADFYSTWLDGRLRQEGFRSHTYGLFDQVLVIAFEKE